MFYDAYREDFLLSLIGGIFSQISFSDGQSVDTWLAVSCQKPETEGSLIIWRRLNLFPRFFRCLDQDTQPNNLEGFIQLAYFPHGSISYANQYILLPALLKDCHFRNFIGRDLVNVQDASHLSILYEADSSGQLQKFLPDKNRTDTLNTIFYSVGIGAVVAASIIGMLFTMRKLASNKVPDTNDSLKQDLAQPLIV